MLLLVVLIIVAGLVIFISSKPSQFRVERSLNIQAGVEKILPYIQNFHQWAAWSPYEKMDKDMKKTFSGADSGVGAVYEWEGKKTGQGRMEIKDVSNSKIGIDLRFTKPMKANNQAEFLFTPADGGTKVTWAMSGDHSFMTKAMSIFMPMEKMLNKDFDAGLASLKSAVEGASTSAASMEQSS